MANELVRREADTLEILSSRLDESLRGCQALVTSGMLPRHLQTPAAVLAVMLRGRELGLGALESVAAVHFVEGRTVLDASAQLARAIQHGVSVEWHESTDVIADVTLHRGGRSYRSRWTIEMARRAGLAGKATWVRYPEAMLRARAITAGIRAFCPDALGSGGAVYSQDEAEDIATPAPAPPPPAPAPRRPPDIDVEVTPIAPPPAAPSWRTEPIADGHDSEFDAGGNRRLGAQLREIGIPMDALSDWLTSGAKFADYIGAARVSAMGPLRRAELIRVLGAKPAIAAACLDWAAAQKPAEREPGEEPAPTDVIPF